MRQLKLQKVVIFAVKHLMILVICMGRFQPSTEQFGQRQLRDCDGDSPMKACLQPGQFIVRNISQLIVLLPTLLLLYILLPGTYCLFKCGGGGVCNRNDSLHFPPPLPLKTHTHSCTATSAQARPSLVAYLIQSHPCPCRIAGPRRGVRSFRKAVGDALECQALRYRS